MWGWCAGFFHLIVVLRWSRRAIVGLAGLNIFLAFGFFSVSKKSYVLCGVSLLVAGVLSPSPSLLIIFSFPGRWPHYPWHWHSRPLLLPWQIPDKSLSRSPNTRWQLSQGNAPRSVYRISRNTLPYAVLRYRICRNTLPYAVIRVNCTVFRAKTENVALFMKCTWPLAHIWHNDDDEVNAYNVGDDYNGKCYLVIWVNILECESRGLCDISLHHKEPCRSCPVDQVLLSHDDYDDYDDDDDDEQWLRSQKMWDRNGKCLVVWV